MIVIRLLIIIRRLLMCLIVIIIANACGVGAGAPQMAFDMQRLSHGATHL